ncbi:hypothetical protein JDV02_003300 [Purpureocillium takamizusanense]|uniref:Thioesterase domain-containing protein n=1 Tax=Purpureocillium takamizusanense TaxID=2060973 RepID=A0A9Q8QDU9_9HYPO|nr:uncharacterized protein JDV02_003300 [Purpureocillium takamizusanense]UNI16912.1 hypothetical protein JDV02_003300 [Purpureocillium takamizusanense]
MSEKPPSSSSSAVAALSPLNRVTSPSLNLLPPNSPPRLFESAVEHFSSIPWCAALIHDRSAAGGPLPGNGQAAIAFISQCVNPVSTRHDQYVGRTLSHGHPYAATATAAGSSPPTSSTSSPLSSSDEAGDDGFEAERARGPPIRHMLSLFRPDDASQLRDPSRPILRVASLFALGGGTSGYGGIVHGGLIATILDESLGFVNELNTALGKEGDLFSASSVTASLNVKFLAPVTTTEKAICVTSWIEAMQGRKTILKAEVTNGKGEKLAVAESIWVAVKPRL